MANNWLRWVVLAVAAAVTGAWLWQAIGGLMQVLAALGLALAVLVGALWRSRVRAARRWRTALDGYAERELVRVRRRKPRPSASRVSRGDRSGRASVHPDGRKVDGRGHALRFTRSIP